jgi:hypothetical protein
MVAAERTQNASWFVEEAGRGTMLAVMGLRPNQSWRLLSPANRSRTSWNGGGLDGWRERSRYEHLVSGMAYIATHIGDRNVAVHGPVLSGR